MNEISLFLKVKKICRFNCLEQLKHITIPLNPNSN